MQVTTSDPPHDPPHDHRGQGHHATQGNRGITQDAHDGHDAVDDGDAHEQSTAFGVQTTVSDLSLQDMGGAWEPVSKAIPLAEEARAR